MNSWALNQVLLRWRLVDAMTNWNEEQAGWVEYRNNPTEADHSCNQQPCQSQLLDRASAMTMPMLLFN
ncbi:hypothetical protein HanIR_Chr07g0308671 [Helianthus annuus]|nr:hypothetical protein HanIR_Chr07g0308671 [Helianthus annuus]